MSLHVTIAAGLAVAGVVAGTLFLVRPADRQTRATYAEVAELTPLIATGPVHNARLHDLGYALDELSAHVRSICRVDADVEDGESAADAIHRAIAAPGVRVRAVRSGAPRAADHGTVLPMTVQLEGPFDAVFERLRRAESLPQPARVTSVSMDVIDAETRDASPRLAVSLDLELARAATEVSP